MLETTDFKTIFLNRHGPNNKEQKKVEDVILSVLNQLNENDVRNIPTPLNFIDKKIAIVLQMIIVRGMTTIPIKTVRPNAENA